MEVLGHNPSEVRLERLSGGDHPLLLEHDTTKQIGVIEKAWLDGTKGRAVVRFGHSALAEEIFNDVKSGIRSLVSVGYRVDRFEKQETRSGEEEEEPTYRATDWTPYEISVVAIPADAGVGVGKKLEEKGCIMPQDNKEAELEAKKKLEAERAELDKRKQEAEEAEQKRKEEKAREELEKERQTVQRNEATRIAELYSVANRYGKADKVKDAVQKGLTVEQFKSSILDDMGGEEGATVRAFDASTASTETGSSGKSIGDLFISSEDYKRVGSKVGEKRGVSIVIPDRADFSRATFSATTESLTSIQKLPGIPGLLDQQPLRIAQLFAQGTTTALTVRYIQEDTYTNAATAVAEGAAKPEATLDVSEVDATVRKIAVYLKVTDEMFADFAQMRSYVDGRLGYMVQALEDNHLLNGTGASNQITGVLNVSGIQTEDASASSTPADAIYKAITKVRSVGFVEPDAIVIHPNDYRDLKLTKDQNGQYHGGGPFFGQYGNGMYSNVGMLWGLPAVITTAITEGTALVGAFRIGGQLWRRMGLTVEATNSDQDDFINNLVTIRAECRLTLATYKPLAFASVTNIA